MVIEHAERFGIAQLHQLRGRVGRGAGNATRILMYQPSLSELTKAPLSAIRQTSDGFVIAEEDLRLRGAGELLGTLQSGMPLFRLADLAVHADLVAAARDDARRGRRESNHEAAVRDQGYGAPVLHGVCCARNTTNHTPAKKRQRLRPASVRPVLRVFRSSCDNSAFICWMRFSMCVLSLQSKKVHLFNSVKKEFRHLNTNSPWRTP
ncbi:MAG TPA: hypothetical protein VKR31_13320 [Rhizomicrobium sp.]|nr:hypothetical protein [Rhizomicrobium sp.]